MILGVNTSHDCCFCILDERGIPLYVLEEERFNRVKHSGFATFESLKALERAGLVEYAQVTDIVYSFEMDEQITAELMDKCYANVAEAFGSKVLTKASTYFHQPEQGFSFIRGLGLQTRFKDAIGELQSLFPNALQTSYKHHLCHAASAFYPAPFSSAAVLIVDGSGRLETTTIWQANEDGIKLLEQTELPHSIGILYWLFSHYLWLEEGQTMGLAAYGKPIFKDLLYDRVLALDDQGNLRFKAPIVSWFDMDNEYAIRVIEDLMGMKARSSLAEPLTQFHANVAASIQEVTEEVILKLAARAKQLTGESNLCLAGGVIQNCVANGRLVAEKIMDQVWIQPMANDSGTALGAALYHHYQSNPCQTTARWRMTSAQLGMGYTNRQVENYLQRLEIPYKKSCKPAQEAAQKIADGCVLGWFQAKAEVGPRALGGRSILADPRQRFNPFAVNQIKQRQPWRPFAPSILEQQESQFIGFEAASPFMILSFPILPHLRPQVPAICHVDGSARIQTVSPEACRIYHSLLTYFYEMTSVPAVLNTSFNLRGEPIVQHPLDAIRDFLISGIDCLFLNDYIVEEKAELDPLLLEALTASPFLSLFDRLSSEPHPLLIVQHTQMTAEEGRRERQLLCTLEWLRLPYKRVSPSGLQDTFGLAMDKHHLLSIAHGLDEKVLHTLLDSYIKRITVSAINRKMYPATVTAERFLSIIGENYKELHQLIDEKEVLAWANGDDLANIMHELSRFNVKPAAVITNNYPGSEHDVHDIRRQPHTYLLGRKDRVFLILSSSVMDRFKSELRLYGYHSGSGYLVWDA